MLKLILIPVLVVAMLCLLVVGIDFYLSPRDELKNADVIVAISGGDTEARTRQAVELYKQGYAPKVLFSGAALDPLSPSNAEVMQKIALESGVPEKDILIDETAKNTAQNARQSQAILQTDKYKTIILVTSPYHQRRAFLEFSDKLGADVEIINYSSSDKRWTKRWYLTPTGWWLGLSESVKTAITAAKNLN